MKAIKNKWSPLKSKSDILLRTLAMDIYNNQISIIYSSIAFDRHKSVINLDIRLADDNLRNSILRILNPNLEHWEQHLITSSLSNIFYKMNPRSYKRPKNHSDSYSLENKRDNLIYDLVERDKEEIEFERDFKYYSMEKKEYYNTVVPSIGFIYTFKNQNLVLYIKNEDCVKLIKYYNEYKAIRIHIDKNFENAE